MNNNRRNAIKLFGTGGAGVLVSLPENWVRPVVNAALLPAHAVTTVDVQLLQNVVPPPATAPCDSSISVVSAYPTGDTDADTDIAIVYDCENAACSIQTGIWAEGRGLPVNALIGLDLDLDDAVDSPSLLWDRLGPGGNWTFAGDTNIGSTNPQGSYFVTFDSTQCNVRVSLTFDTEIVRISPESRLERLTVSNVDIKTSEIPSTT